MGSSDEFLVLLYFHVHLLLYLLNCLYLYSHIFPLLPLQLSPPSHCRRVSKHLCGV